jgi:hypothetical protein
MAQIEHLPSKCEALSSNPSTTNHIFHNSNQNDQIPKSK